MARSNQAANADRSGWSQRSDGIDLEVEIDIEDNWIEVDIEIEHLDFDLELDARDLLPDPSPDTSTLAGDEGAVDESALVDADIVSRLIGFGSVTVAFGAAKVTSSAVSDPGAAFASETTFGDASGADLVFVFNKTTSSSFEGEVSYGTSVSTTTYIAIDFEGLDFAEGQIAVDCCDEMDIVTEAESAGE
jgi:hypothetical protein